MDFDEFIARVGSLLGIEIPQPTNPYDSLYDDLGLDSFQAFELMIIVESLAEAMVPPVDMPDLFTPADAYEYYQHLRAAELRDP